MSRILRLVSTFHACIVIRNKAVVDSRLCFAIGVEQHAFISLVNAKLTSLSYVHQYVGYIHCVHKKREASRFFYNNAGKY